MTRPSSDPETDPMLDFQQALAGELRAAARPAAVPAVPTARRSRRWSPRPWLRAAGALGVPALAAAATGAFFLAPDRVVVASAKPPILQAPEIDPAPFRDSVVMHAVLGPDAVPTEAYEVPTNGESVYLYGGEAGWCLAGSNPELRRAGAADFIGCTLAKDFERFGIAITDTHYVAALPADVPPPVLRTPDGRERTLTPSSDYAIVDVEAPKGSSVVRFAKDGSTRVDPIR